MHFQLYRLRLTFRARDPIRFPEGSAANWLRGAFGSILHKMDYASVFSPSSEAGPSGLKDRPRPFVFRAHPLDGTMIAPGEKFHFYFHWFDLNRASLELILRAFAELPRAELLEVQGSDAPMQLCLEPVESRVTHLTIRFETPLELKAGSRIADRPEFGILAARTRDRISTLRALYGGGAVDIGFREFGDRAAQIRMTRCDLRPVQATRRSGRTGQTHSLDGFVGEAEYEGDLAEFIPYLRVAHWTGVGRQTAWGKGVLTLGER